MPGPEPTATGRSAAVTSRDARALGRDRAELIERGDLRGTRWRLGGAAGATRTGLSRYRLGGRRARDAGARARRRGGALLRARRRGAELAGRAHLRGARPATASCTCRAPRRTPSPARATGSTCSRTASGSDTGADLAAARAGDVARRRAGCRSTGPTRSRAEAAAGRSSCPRPSRSRPPTIVALADGELARQRRGDVAHVRRDLGDALARCGSASVTSSSSPGMLSYPPHCHSAEEELFVVLDGGGDAAARRRRAPGAARQRRRAPAGHRRPARVPRR